MKDVLDASQILTERSNQKFQKIILLERLFKIEIEAQSTNLKIIIDMKGVTYG